MGIDLSILPQYSENADFSHDVIQLHRDYELFEVFETLQNARGRTIGKDSYIWSFLGRDEEGEFEEYCYGKLRDNPYGNPLVNVLASDLKKALKESDYLKKNPLGLSWKNRAAIAYINELPDDLPIWLFWH